MDARIWMALAALTASTAASAGCEIDTDCKGARICEAGVCTEPTTATTTTPAPAPVATVGLSDLQRVELHRARSKASAGYVGAGLTAAFGIGAIAVIEEKEPAIGLGSLALTSVGITLPIAASGGSRARRVARESGIVPPNATLPVVAWIGYTVAMSEGLALIALGANDITPPVEVVSTSVLLGAVSALGMGVDAKVTSDRVEAAIKSGRTVARHRPQLTLTPVVQRRPDGATFGVAGVF